MCDNVLFGSSVQTTSKRKQEAPTRSKDKNTATNMDTNTDTNTNTNTDRVEKSVVQQYPHYGSIVGWKQRE